MQAIRLLKYCSVLSLFSITLVACQMQSNGNQLDNTTRVKADSPRSIAQNNQKKDSARPSALTAFAPSKKLASHQGSSMTMETAVRRAVDWHPAINQAGGRILQADEKIRAAEAGYYPKIKAGVNSGYESNDRGGWRPQFGVSASQMLYDFGKVSSAVETETAGKKVNTARYLLTMDNLARDTANAVIEVQRYRELSRLAQEQVDGVKVIADLVETRTQKGASTMSDQVQATARVESALSTQLQYQSEYSRWQVALAALTGGNATSVNPVSGVPDWLNKACNTGEPDWKEVPAMLEAVALKEEAVAQVAASRAEGLPTVSLEASTGYDLNSRYDASTSNDHQPEYSIGMNVSSDLYNGGHSAARKRAASYALQSAEAAMQAAQVDMQRSLLEARSQIGAQSRLTASLASRADMMVETRDLYREQYVSLGTRTLLDLLNAEQELHEAQFQTANTMHDVRRLNVSCLYSSGKMRDGFGIQPKMLGEGGTSHVPS